MFSSDWPSHYVCTFCHQDSLPTPPLLLCLLFWGSAGWCRGFSHRTYGSWHRAILPPVYNSLWQSGSSGTPVSNSDPWGQEMKPNCLLWRCWKSLIFDNISLISSNSAWEQTWSASECGCNKHIFLHFLMKRGESAALQHGNVDRVVCDINEVENIRNTPKYHTIQFNSITSSKMTTKLNHCDSLQQCCSTLL